MRPARPRWMASPNHEPRGPGPIDILLLHYTAMDCADKACQWLCDPQSRVSAHYLVDESGSVTQMVGEDRRAWHAGLASWGGEADINSRSIGIEIHNEGPQSASPEFPDRQIEAVIELSKGILSRHLIPPARVLAHSDVSPGRKIDPGPNFPWKHLAGEGVGLWPGPLEPEGGDGLGSGDSGKKVLQLQQQLAKFGYGIETSGIYDATTETVVAAFQLHFRASKVDGRCDPSTFAILKALLNASEPVATI